MVNADCARIGLDLRVSVSVKANSSGCYSVCCVESMKDTVLRIVSTNVSLENTLYFVC